MTVRSHTEWPVLFREESYVVVNAEGKVVGYEILAGGTDVEWVEVREGTSEGFELVLRDVGGLGEGARSEDVVPDLVGHLLNSDTQWSRGLSLDVRYNWKSSAKTEVPSEGCKRTVQKVSDGIIAHIDRRVTEALDQELRVPRQPRTKPIGSRASPLVQPVQSRLESVSGLNTICFHLLQEPGRLSTKPVSYNQRNSLT